MSSLTWTGCGSSPDVSPGHNAYTAWAEAFEAVVALDDFVTRTGGDEEEALTLEDSLHDVLNDGQPLPGGRAERRLRRWVEENGKALVLFDAGTLYPHFQVPEPDKADPGDGMNFVDLLDLKRLRARISAKDEHHQDAAEEIRGLLRAAEVIGNGETLLVHHLMFGRNCQLAVLRDLRWLTSVLGTTEESFQGFLSQLGSAPGVREQLKAALAVELRQFVLPRVASLPEGDDPGALAHELMAGDPRYSRIASIEAALDGHPDVFDRDRTRNLIKEHFRTIARNLDGPWSERSFETFAAQREFLEKWPHGSVPDLADLFATLADQGDSSPDPEEIARSREALRTVDNPLGRLVVATLFWWTGGPVGLIESAFLADAEREATRTLLALRLYRMLRKKPAGNLADLVESDILPELPRDPFSGGSLGYAKDRWRLWSVGADGRENGRRGLLDEAGLVRPTVWAVPHSRFR